MFGDDLSAAKEAIIRETEIDNVIRDGKVYFSADALSETFRHVAGLMALRAVVMQSTEYAFLAEGIGIAGDFIGELNSEILRREAAAMLAATDE